MRSCIALDVLDVERSQRPAQDTCEVCHGSVEVTHVWNYVVPGDGTQRILTPPSRTPQEHHSARTSSIVGRLWFADNAGGDD